MNTVRILAIALVSGLYPLGLLAETVRYELHITQGSVNLSGKETVDFAIMVNGSIPAPTLEFTEGDEAEITVHNHLKDEEASIHWHGILLPPEMDGVPYVNTPPIHPGKSFTFRFTLRQNGTYWYHSHTAVQEQKGVYGAFVVHPRKKKFEYDRDLIVVLSDWSDENADKIMRNLRKDGDYYLYKKNSIRSWFGAIQAKGFGTLLSNEWTRMGGMDLSDVGYDAFLINGKIDSQLLEAHPGEKIRIRIINAAASSYFYVSLGQEPMTVVSADGLDIEPIVAKEILMGMAETYDVLFEVPDHKSYELRATVQDVTGYASGWIGRGEKVHATEKAKPNLYESMSHGGHSDHHEGGHHDEKEVQEGEAKIIKNENHVSSNSHDHHEMHHHGPAENSEGEEDQESPDMKSAIRSLTVDHLRAETTTAFEAEIPRYDLTLVLGGDMERYVWHMNGKAIHQDRTIEVREGDVVRFTFVNETMMHHPMHLHGHFFRVLTSAGEYSPLKHTVDVPPHGKRTIEFLANEVGEWMLHCHNLYHMKTGMARVVRYISYTPKPEIAHHQKHDPHMHEHLYSYGSIGLMSNQASAEFRLLRTWDALTLEIESRKYDTPDHIEGDVLYRRWFSNFFHLAAGGTYVGEYDSDRTRGVMGFGYVLPMLIETSFFVDHRGKLRIDAEKKFQWTKYIFSDLELTYRQDAGVEFEGSLMYAHRWDWSAGLLFTEESIGAGVEVQF